MSVETHTAEGGAGHSDDHHAHPAHLAHHFESSEQQFSAGKLGMWLFLATEILLFGGLFVAYSVYRGNHPEIFKYAHHFLDAKLGGINTVVLITSSFTMALGVRASQMGKQWLLVTCLALTLMGGFGFLGIKYIEYSHKIHHGLMWGTHYQPDEHILAEHAGAHEEDAQDEAHSSRADHHAEEPHPAADIHAATAAKPHNSSEMAAAPASSTGEQIVPPLEASLVPTGGEAPSGTVFAAKHQVHHDEIVPKNVHIFFGIYFLMTGLHGIHVLLGMGAIFWVLLRSLKGDFSPEYFTPVDLVGLYWHVVDLIWIYLFPLLYLIH